MGSVVASFVAAKLEIGAFWEVEFVVSVLTVAGHA